jgi:hypothetical protein
VPSGHCAFVNGNGFGNCCSTACTGNCSACGNGTCGPVARGFQPGNPPCGNNIICNGSSLTCGDTCSSDQDCVGGTFCDQSGACVPPQSNGASCNQNQQCASNNGGTGPGACIYCDATGCHAANTTQPGWPGVCCDLGNCTASCQTCATGTCQPRAAGESGVPACPCGFTCDGMSATCPP